MSQGMRVQAKSKNGVTQVKALINHPMETGNRKDQKTDQTIPAHFIEEVVCEYNGEKVMVAEWSGGVSKNPYLAFKFNGGNPGDTIKVSWKDNKDGSDTVDVIIK
jgi:sulfur-oxidizing protein SoxZ